MTKEVKTLSSSDVKRLVKARFKLKEVERDFKNLKDELITEDVPLGKYESQDGYVTKYLTTRRTIDTKKLLEDHPEINIEEYTTEKECVQVNIDRY